MQTAIVLGGTVPHIELLTNLKERGYRTILIDYLDNPPAKDFADLHIKESTLDKEAILRITKEEKADLVISACIDQTNAICCWVAQELNLPYPYNYEIALLVTNKGMMKAKMKEKFIPTSDFHVISSLEEINKIDLNFPCVIKPVDSNSSKGVRRVENHEEIKKHFFETISFSRTGQIIVEEFIDGIEIQIDCLALEKGTKILMTRKKNKISNEIGLFLQSCGSSIPANLNELQLSKVKDIADKIASGFTLRNTPFFFQAIINGEDINVLEFAPRIGGGLSAYLHNELLNFSSVDSVIDSFLNRKINDQFKTNPVFTQTFLFYSKEGILDHIEGLEELKEKGIIKDFFIYKRKGDYLKGNIQSSNRVCSVIVQGISQLEVENKILKCIQNLRILDPDNNDLSNKDLYKFAVHNS